MLSFGSTHGPIGNGPTPTMPTTAIAQMSIGIEASPSIVRIETCSHRPRAKPALRPIAIPPSPPIVTARTPTVTKAAHPR